MGRVVPEIEPKDIRERIVYGCRLIYRIEKKRILVAAIIHGSSARLMQAFARRAKARNKSNYAFQLTPPHCGGFLASLGAADRERYIS
jgi:hypothetical protein